MTLNYPTCMRNYNQYNQKMLAVLGTLLCAGLVFLLLSGVYLAISSINFRRDKPRIDPGIVVNQNQVVDTTKFEFSQEISVLEPYQLDTSKPVFIVPIGQIDQKSSRTTYDKAGIAFETSYSSKDYKYSSFSGLYNNFVLVDYDRGIKIPVFNTKVAIEEWAYIKVDSSELVLFKGTDTDLNNDGRLNDHDFQHLFVFDVSTLENREFRFENQTVLDFEPLSLTSKIYVRTGKDLNGDHKYSSYKEPKDLYFYDVTTGESETLIPDSIKQNIQEILNK